MKKKSTFYCAVFFLVFGLISCKSEVKKAETTQNSSEESTNNSTTSYAVTEKPELVLVQVVFDALQMRSEPDLKAKVVQKFAANDFLEATGKVGDKEIEAILGGLLWVEPFVEVVSTTPEQHRGWLHGGGLQTIFAGKRADAPDLGKLSEFGMFLRGLDVKKLGSGDKAWAYVKTNFGNAQGSLADASFFMLERFIRRMDAEGEFYTQLEKIQFSDADFEKIYDGTFDMSKLPLTRSLKSAGFKLGSGEGMVFQVPDYPRFLAEFGDKVSPAVRSYLVQTELEQRKPTYEDAAIVIPMDEVAERAVFWEKFNAQYPNFPRASETQEHEQFLSISYLFGLNNTPTFDYETKTLSPETKQSWDNFLAKYPNTKLAKSLREFYDLVASEGNKSTPKVEKYIEGKTIVGD